MPPDPAYLFLRDLALILGTAAVGMVLFQRLRLPVIVGYLVAGLLVRPLIHNVETIRILAELGVVLLLFSIGLEFRLRRLAVLGPRVALAMVVEVGLMLVAGYAAAQLLGWTPLMSLLAAGIVAISSTMIAAGTLADVQADSSRYRMLDLIRQYGRAKAEETDEWRTVLDRHLAFFLGLAQQAAREAQQQVV